ncbi:MAG TPA: class I SAM-dependent methyltransferase [Candidatus Thermoplasmatota archaeon]|nr:class I SAM-dependent methyltransferase [Candidatus Thermoplasmatota archaeon]
MTVWPAGFARIPDEEWTRAPVATLAAKYDAVGRHGWYDNLDPSVAELARELRGGDVLVDYSGGTGLLIERLLAALGAREVGIVDVDSSPKFLALALEKLRDEPRVAFRLIRYLKDEKRLETLDEALGAAMMARGVDAIVSANAVHLYYGLDDTLAAWSRALRPGGFVHVQSGNVRNADAPTGAWIIDDTVAAVDAAAREIVRADSHFRRHRPALDDASRMAAHDAFRQKVFLPPRPLGHYVDALERAGLAVERVWTRPVAARADEWHEFLAAYSDAVLGWVGGTEKVEGRPPSKEDLEERLSLMRLALGVVLTGRESFDATWTYVNARKRA